MCAAGDLIWYASAGATNAFGVIPLQANGLPDFLTLLSKHDNLTQTQSRSSYVFFLS